MTRNEALHLFIIFLNILNSFVLAYFLSYIIYFDILVNVVFFSIIFCYWFCSFGRLLIFLFTYFVTNLFKVV